MTTVETPVQTTDDGIMTKQWRLKIASRQELRQFLRAIQPEFLRVVDPRESGLLDILYAAELLTETDNESMSGKDVHIRKDQARKLWFLLNKMSVDDFLAHVGPVLVRMFPHIIPESYLTQEVEGAPDQTGAHKECLRHDIRSRIRSATMADMLYHHDCLSFEDYEDIASEEYDNDIVWGKMFDSITGHTDDLTMQIVEALKALLGRYKVPVPLSLTELVSRGVPCECDKANFALPASTPLPLRKVGSWVKKSPFFQTPRSSGSSVTRVDLRSYSGGTSFRDNDSKSLSSDDTLVPDYITRLPVHFQHTKLDGLSEEDAQSKSSLKRNVDAVSIMIEESEIPRKSTALESSPAVLMPIFTAISGGVGKGSSEVDLDEKSSEADRISTVSSGRERRNEISGTAFPDVEECCFTFFRRHEEGRCFKMFSLAMSTLVVVLMVLAVVFKVLEPEDPLKAFLDSLRNAVISQSEGMKALIPFVEENRRLIKEIITSSESLRGTVNKHADVLNIILGRRR